jgi:hypothetical protein
MRKIVLCMVGALICVTSSFPALAGEKTTTDLPWEKFSLNVGGFLNATNSSIQLGAEGVGVSLDIEDLLGMDTATTVFRADGAWRFTDNRRHRWDLSWFAVRRSGETTLGRDIPIDDTTVLPLGSTVRSSFDLDIYRTAYSYSFFQDERMDLAASIGAFIMPISFELNASGAVTAVRSESITAPLPVIGFRTDFAITPKVFLRASSDIFYLEISDFKGLIVDTKAAVEYAAFEHVGIGLGFESFNLAVEAKGEDYPGVNFKGKLNFTYLGANLYVKLYF